jgi:hypothetical protein
MLVYELAHTFYTFIHPDHLEPYIILELYLPEAAFSWQRYVFGHCQIFNIPCTKASVGAVYATDLDYNYVFPSIGVPMGMQWVEHFFMRETWNGVVDICAFKAITARQLSNNYGDLAYVDRLEMLG